MTKTPIQSDLKGSTRPLPLAGVRVLDVSQVMAGPYCCMLLADLGADVIKIEPPGTGDQTRGAMGFKMKGSDSMGFLNMNRNKRSLTLNLKTEAGKKVFYELVKTADILVENYRPGVMKKLGIDYPSLQAINPGLVYASISGFGQTGPWADRPGFDLMAQAMSGVMSVTGYPDGPPVKAGVPVADIGCALFAVYDQGMGIAQEHIPRLTERFYRVDRSRSRDTGGTGLGLAIVKHVVQRHGAELSIASVPGEGSHFQIVFPPPRVHSRPIPVPAEAIAA